MTVSRVLALKSWIDNSRATCCAGAVVVAGTLAFAPPALAAWPEDRPIEILVGYQAGSGPDLLARRIAPVISKHLGGKANFVVNNRTGASSEIAWSALARAEPNGYTIGVLITPSFITVDFIRKPQYDANAIVPLARIVDDPALMIAGGKSPYNSLRDVIAKLKTAPESVSIGNNGIGTNGYLATLALEQSAGVRVNVIPFKGSSESRTALLGGHLDIAVQSISEHALDKESVGLFKPLAQFGSTRASILPEVPTATALGIDGIVSSARGRAMPRGVPAEIVDRLQKAIASAVDDPEFYLNTSRDELQVSYLPGAEWAKSMQERKVRYGEIMKQAAPAK
jgi:tripartite-type tricarboxylate transporter receptor subunit TctC